jgi:hypothetical protein
LRDQENLTPGMIDPELNYFLIGNRPVQFISGGWA